MTAAVDSVVDSAEPRSAQEAVARAPEGQAKAVLRARVSAEAQDASQTIGAVADNGDGTYSAEITASTSIETSTITATVASVTPSLVGITFLTQVGGPPSRIATGAAGEGSISTTDRGGGQYTATISVARGTQPMAIAVVDETSSPAREAVAVLARTVPVPPPAPSPTPTPAPTPSSTSGPTTSAPTLPTSTAALPPTSAATPDTAGTVSMTSPLGEPIAWAFVSVATFVGLGGGYVARVLLEPRRVP